MTASYKRHHSISLSITGNHNKELVRLRNTYILSNIAPQYELHNKKAWEKWEEYTRTKAKKIEGFLFVITGVTGDKKLVHINQYYIITFYYIIFQCPISYFYDINFKNLLAACGSI